MREPGEDEEGGEYYQMAFTGAPAQTTLGTDHCQCPKPPGCWGAHGFHHRPDPEHPASISAARVYERCPAYSAAVQRSGGYQKKATGRGRGRRARR